MVVAASTVANPNLGMAPRDMYEPDLHIDILKEQARNFR
jgi:hypothetical protein